MKHTILTALAGLALLAGCNNEQPLMNCNTAHGAYAVTYTLVGTAPAEGSRCDLRTDVVGLQKYTHEGEQRVYLTPLEIGNSNVHGDVALAPGGAGMAIGVMESKKPVDGICAVESFERAEAKEAEGTASLSHTFSNMSFLVSPAAPGTIVKYRVIIRDSVDNCTATYDAVGMFPVVGCDDSGTAAENDAQCALTDGWWSGLALNPSFDVACRTAPSMIRVTDGDVPAICAPRDPANLFCPDSGCSWRPADEE